MSNVQSFIPSSNYSMVPNELYTTPGLKSGHKLIYAVLKTFQFKENVFIFPSMKTIAERSSQTRNTVTKYINDMHEWKMIRVYAGEYQGKHINNRYAFNPPSEWKIPTGKEKKSHLKLVERPRLTLSEEEIEESTMLKNCARNTSKFGHGVRQNLGTNNTNSNKTKKKNTSIGEGEFSSIDERTKDRKITLTKMLHLWNEAAKKYGMKRLESLKNKNKYSTLRAINKLPNESDWELVFKNMWRLEWDEKCMKRLIISNFMRKGIYQDILDILDDERIKDQDINSVFN